MSEKQLNRNISSEQDKLLNDEMEIDLMDILRKIISIRKTLYKAAGIGLIMGIIVAFSIPKQYTYLQPIITQYFIDNKSEIWLLFLIAHSKR